LEVTWGAPSLAWASPPRGGLVEGPARPPAVGLPVPHAVGAV